MVSYTFSNLPYRVPTCTSYILSPIALICFYVDMYNVQIKSPPVFREDFPQLLIAFHSSRSWSPFLFLRLEVKSENVNEEMAVFWIRIVWFQIQHFRLIPIRIRIQSFDDQKFKNLQLKKLDIFLSMIAIYLSLDLHKGRPSYRKNLQPSKDQLFKTWNFLTSFIFVLIRIPNPDPPNWLNPDPKHWFTAFNTRFNI